MTPATGLSPTSIQQPGPNSSIPLAQLDIQQPGPKFSIPLVQVDPQQPGPNSSIPLSQLDPRLHPSPTNPSPCSSRRRRRSPSPSNSHRLPPSLVFSRLRAAAHPLPPLVIQPPPRPQLCKPPSPTQTHLGSRCWSFWCARRRVRSSLRS